MDSNSLNILQDPNTLLILRTILHGSIPLICLYISKTALKHYTINRDYQPKDISTISFPPSIQQVNTEIDLNRFTEEKVKEVIEKFEDVLKKEFSPNSTALFYRNIRSANIKKKKGILLLGDGGNYNCYANRINYMMITALYHELFHLSNSYFDEKKKMALCGFSQCFKVKGKFFNTIYVGDGINEGYTELLTQRYFGETHDIPKAYLLEVRIAGLLEKIVGEEKMKDYYMRADLFGLIEELKQYSSEEDILRFISGVDVINKHFYDDFLLKSRKIEASVKHTYSFLMEAYINKARMQVERGEMTPDEFAESANRFTESLGLCTRIGDIKYDFFTREYLFKLDKDIMNIQKEFKENAVSMSR